MQYKVFKKKFFLTEGIGIFFGLPVTLAYSLLLIDFPEGKAQLILSAASIAGILVVVFMALPMNLWYGRKAAAIALIDDGKPGQEDMENLFVYMARLPIFQSLAVSLRIVLGAIIITQIYMRIIGLSSSAVNMTLAMGIYGAYTAGMVTYLVTYNICSPVNKLLIEKKLITEQFLENNKTFGMSFTVKIIVYLVVPLFFTNMAVILAVQSSLANEISRTAFSAKMIGLSVVNLLTLGTSIIILRNMIVKPNRLIEIALEALVKGDNNISAKISTDAADEFGRVSYLMNQTMDIFLSILHQIDNSASNLNNLTLSISSANQEISTSSNQQAAAVKEIVTTMEDSDKLSKSIAKKVEEVAQIAEQTQSGVDTGFHILQNNLNTMDAIRDRNADTIEGIRTLGEKIEHVWEIVKIINSIADQTKIIAFNAELEASSAGAAGKNFQIVASEIRRLADSTMKSTTQIKSRINEIQSSSDKLILASEEGTKKISEGWQLSAELNNIFKDIQSSSEISAASAKQIEVSIKQQVQAFEQILLTLKQIADSVQSFVISTNDTSLSSEKLKQMTVAMSSILEKFFGRNEEGNV